MNTRTLLPLATIFCLLLPSAHAATRTWDGGGPNNDWTTATNWVGDVAPVAGDDLIFPAGGASQLSSNNDFPAGTSFSSITFLGAGYTLNGTNIALSAGISTAFGVGSSTIYLPLTLSANQSFTVSNVNFSAALNLRGPIDLAANTLTFAGAGSFQVQSVITGAGGLRKLGIGGALLYATNTFSGPIDVLEGSLSIYRAPALGTTNGATFVQTNAQLVLGSGAGGPFVVQEPLTLAGTLGGVAVAYRWAGPITLTASNATVNVNSPSAPLVVDGPVSGDGGLVKRGPGTLTLNADNAYTNRTRILDGVLVVNGIQPQSAVTLEAGTLGGTGAVGTVTASGAFAKTLAPGGRPGVLTCSNVTLSASTTFRAELNGTAPGSGYDRLNVNGTVTLGGCVVSNSLGFAPAAGASFTIINNDGSDAVVGTFSGLAEGTILNVAGKPLQITYTGGDGNDVVLTRISPPTRFTSVGPLTNGHIPLQATGGLAGFSYTIEAATNLTPVISVVQPWHNCCRR